jgi:hypothetical protein
MLETKKFEILTNYSAPLGNKNAPGSRFFMVPSA